MSAIGFVQQKTANAATGTTLAVTLDAASTAGNCLIMAIGSAAAAVSSISGGGTWARVKLSASHVYTDLWCCYNCSAVSTVTVTFASDPGKRMLNLSEWRGLKFASTPKDANAAAAGIGTTQTTATITPTVAGNLVIALALTTAGVYASGPSDFSALTESDNGNIHMFSGYLIQSAATVASTGWTTSSYGGWDAVIADFKENEDRTGTGTLASTCTLTATGAKGGRGTVTLASSVTFASAGRKAASGIGALVETLVMTAAGWIAYPFLARMGLSTDSVVPLVSIASDTPSVTTVSDAPTIERLT